MLLYVRCLLLLPWGGGVLVFHRTEEERAQWLLYFNLLDPDKEFYERKI